MEDFKKNWDVQHGKYAQAEWIDKPTLFAQEVIRYFPKKGSVLDIGCGQGQDSRYFAEHGHPTIGMDLSSEGIAFAKAKTSSQLGGVVTFMQGDASKPLPFPDTSFDIVYSHLALHYFDKITTEKVFREIHRVLKPDGIFAALFNSVNDTEYGSGEKKEDDYYHIGNMYKRFFSTRSVRGFAKDFEIMIADEEGETYKDRAVGNAHLARFVGRKIK